MIKIRRSLACAQTSEVSYFTCSLMYRFLLCTVVVKEFERLLDCTAELFGSSAHYFLKLTRGISTSIGCLDIRQTVSVGIFCISTLLSEHIGWIQLPLNFAPIFRLLKMFVEFILSVF